MRPVERAHPVEYVHQVVRRVVDVMPTREEESTGGNQHSSEEFDTAKYVPNCRTSDFGLSTMSRDGCSPFASSGTSFSSEVDVAGALGERTLLIREGVIQQVEIR